MSNTSHKHGGARPYAGRNPKTEDKALNRTLRVPDKLWEAAKIVAELQGKTRNRWIIDLMEQEIDKEGDV